MTTTDEPPLALPPAEPQPAKGSNHKRTIITLAALVVISLIVIVGWIANEDTPTGDDYTGLTPRQAVSKWITNGGYARATALDTAVNALRTLRPNAYPSEVRASCLNVYQAAQNAFEYGPIPDGEAQAHWSTALAHIESYANWCINGIDAGATSGSNDVDISNYNEQLVRFNTRMKEILQLPAGAVPTANVHRDKITINGKPRSDTALVVPNSAVILQGGNSYVNVPGPYGPTRKQFTPGLVGDNTTVVLGGLYEGEEILLPQGY